LISSYSDLLGETWPVIDGIGSSGFAFRTANDARNVAIESRFSQTNISPENVKG
jgi:hypothetical protein